MPISVNLTNFNEEVLNVTDKVVVCDFFAEWCGPCEMLSPILEEIEKEHSDKIKVCKINIDEETLLADKFQVESIPLLVVFKDGKIINATLGFKPKEYLLKLFNL